MKKAIIVYQSKTGTTKSFAEAIKKHLQSKQLETRCHDVTTAGPTLPGDTDLLLLGCWTKGLMVICQHPDAEWSNYARDLVVPDHAKLVLFTTYKLRTGSMFRKMAGSLGITGKNSLPALQSRDGKLTEKDQRTLDLLMAG